MTLSQRIKGYASGCGPLENYTAGALLTFAEEVQKLEKEVCLEKREAAAFRAMAENKWIIEWTSQTWYVRRYDGESFAFGTSMLEAVEAAMKTRRT